MKRKIFTIFLFLSGISFAQLKITDTNHYYTFEQMLLANEINESGEPFAEALGYNLDDLDPFIPYSPDSISYNLGINNYEYSRYQLGTIVARSGMGLHLIWGPVLGANAAMETDPNFDGSFTGSPNGFKEDDEMKKTMMHFGMLANHTPPMNAWPQFAEFYSGDPHLPQPIDAANFTKDFATLRWNRSKMDLRLNPAAMGQTLMKQYLWAQDMLGAFHNENDEGIDADGTISPDSAGSFRFNPSNNVFYGGNNLDGFIGMMLTAEAINKVKFTLNNLFYDGNQLGMVDPMTYDPANGIKYFPHFITVTEEIIDATMPPKASQFSIDDPKSNLFDQLSFLWGTINFKNMMDPDNSSDSPHLAYHSVFDGDPFPAPMSATGNPGPYDLMKGASKVFALNILNMHFNSDNGTFVDNAWLENNIIKTDSIISTVNAGYIIVILKQVVEEFNGTGLDQMAKDDIMAQADFIIANLKNSNGFYTSSFNLSSNESSGIYTVESQAAAIRGLYSAYQITNNSLYLNEANNAYDKLISGFYDSQNKAFLTDLSSTDAVYTPFNVALISGAMREASLVGNKSDAPLLYTRFFLNIGNQMQLSEGGSTGELGNDSDGDGIPFIPEQKDNLPPVFASVAEMSLITGIKDNIAKIENYALKQNYPNPFNPSTVIEFSVKKQGLVNISLFNILGQKVAEIVNRKYKPGNHKITFFAGNLSAGVYIYRMQSQNYVSSKKLVLLK